MKARIYHLANPLVHSHTTTLNLPLGYTVLPAMIHSGCSSSTTYLGTVQTPAGPWPTGLTTCTCHTLLTSLFQQPHSTVFVTLSSQPPITLFRRVKRLHYSSERLGSTLLAVACIY